MDTSPTAAQEELRFDRAEFAAPEDATPSCSRCRETPAERYFTSNGSTLCEPCTEHVRKHGPAAGEGGFLRALGYGLFVALLGSAIWYGITATTGYEIGLIGIVVGFAVGSAVRHGSGGRGGWKYQALAMFLVYLAIVTSYVPMLLEEFHKAGPVESGFEQTFYVVFSFGAAFFLPFLAGAENLIGLFIIGISVYEGWKLNKRPDARIEGPFPMPPTASLSSASSRAA